MSSAATAATAIAYQFLEGNGILPRARYAPVPTTTTPSKTTSTKAKDGTPPCACMYSARRSDRAGAGARIARSSRTRRSNQSRPCPRSLSPSSSTSTTAGVATVISTS